MTTWTLKRIVLIAAGVVAGAFLLSKGFAGNPSQALTSGGHAATGPSGSPSPSASPSTGSSGKKSKVRGVVVLVQNGTDVQGIAAQTTQTLKNRGYTMRDPATTRATAKTTIYYRNDSLRAAQYLQKRYFPNAPLKPATSGQPADVQITVVLGADYSQASSPSP